MKALKRLFANPVVRLFARAAAAAAVYAVPHLHAAPNVDHTLLITIAVGAGWAALEAVTPLNGLVGAFKTLEQLDPRLRKLDPPADLPDITVPAAGVVVVPVAPPAPPAPPVPPVPPAA